jgi:hypothetical protein
LRRIASWQRYKAVVRVITESGCRPLSISHPTRKHEENNQQKTHISHKKKIIASGPSLTCVDEIISSTEASVSGW